MIREFCRVSENEYDDFVGLRFQNGEPLVVFPRGFSLCDNDRTLRHDIVRLLSTIQKFSGHSEGERRKNNIGEALLSFPLLSYQFIIYDFLAHGYYTEDEVRYTKGQKGKTSWKRTIQQISPKIDNDNAVYLNFVLKTNRVNTRNLITKIHEYCVYESFSKLGWLYLETEALPRKPEIKLNVRMFTTILRKELDNTFNDRKKKLFQSMINVISCVGEYIADEAKASFGVQRFEHVWEGMIDYVFGESNRDLYFPRAKWHILSNMEYKIESSVLVPDTIMKKDDKVYIIDAKYYKYGITKNPFHLPATDSIQKQITYGRYVDSKGLTNRDNIYNAFLMPYRSEDYEQEVYKFVSVGTADWEQYSQNAENYKYVLGILVDTTYLLRTYSKHNEAEVEKLSHLIEESLADYRQQGNKISANVPSVMMDSLL